MLEESAQECKTCKTYKSFPVLGGLESENVRLVRYKCFPMFEESENV